MREVLGEMCEWNSVDNCEKAATRSKNVRFGARMRTQCRCNVSEMGSDGLKSMTEESAIKLERFGAKYVSEKLLKTAKKVAARGENVTIWGENSNLLPTGGRGRMADA